MKYLEYDRKFIIDFIGVVEVELEGKQDRSNI